MDRLYNLYIIFFSYNEAPRRSMKPAESGVQSDEPFTGETGYKVEYTKKQIPERERREKREYVPNKAALDGLSNYRKDFVAKEMEKAASFKPEAKVAGSDAPFADETTNRFDFKRWPTDRPAQHQPDVYVKPQGQIDFGTVHTIEYTPKALTKAAIKRPVDRKLAPGKFEGNTNYSTDFRKWDSQPNRPKPKVHYQAPDAPFEGASNYATDYIGHAAPPVRSCKPAEAGVRSDAPFDAGTLYRQEYDKKLLPPCPAGVIQGGGPTAYEFRGQDPSGHKFYEQVVDMKAVTSSAPPIAVA